MEDFGELAPNFKQEKIICNQGFQIRTKKGEQLENKEQFKDDPFQQKINNLEKKDLSKNFQG